MSTHGSKRGTESCKRELSICTREYAKSERPQAMVESWPFQAHGVAVTVGEHGGRGGPLPLPVAAGAEAKLDPAMDRDHHAVVTRDRGIVDQGAKLRRRGPDRQRLGERGA